METTKTPFDLSAMLQALTPNDIEKVYSGRAGRCCCGCSGKYAYNSLHLEGRAARDDVDDKKVLRTLRLIQSMDGDKSLEYMPGSYIAVEIGKRQHIAYFTEKFCDEHAK